MIWVLVTIAAAHLINWITGVTGDAYRATLIWLLVINISLMLYVGIMVEARLKR